MSDRPSIEDTTRATPTRSLSTGEVVVGATMGIWAIIKVGLVALGLVLIPWFFYANQDTQKLRCVGYELSSTPRPFVWTVTCALNGHE